MSFSSRPCESLLLGAHFSIAKGLANALYAAKSYHCNTLQIFTKNAMTWKERTPSPEEINLFKQAKEKTGIEKIASHASYLINLAAKDKKKHAMSIRGLRLEFFRSSMLDIHSVVLHPGSHMGLGEKKGTHLVADSINRIFSETPGLKTHLLLETTAGQGSSLGHTFEQLASIIDQVENKDRIGVCLDTSHIFAAGFDIRTTPAYRKTVRRFDSIVGLDRLYLIHLNDSKKELGARVDRHEHIGKGLIGLKAFELFMNDERFRDIPKVIETPKKQGGKDWDKINLERLRSLVSA
jgi:deoxyribonuclease IV